MNLPNTVEISFEELSNTTDPAKLVYDRLLDAGCPIARNGSMAGAMDGFSSWTTDGYSLCLSWGETLEDQ